MRELARLSLHIPRTTRDDKHVDTHSLGHASSTDSLEQRIAAAIGNQSSPKRRTLSTSTLSDEPADNGNRSQANTRSYNVVMRTEDDAICAVDAHKIDAGSDLLESSVTDVIGIASDDADDSYRGCVDECGQCSRCYASGRHVYHAASTVIADAGDATCTHADDCAMELLDTGDDSSELAEAILQDEITDVAAQTSKTEVRSVLIVAFCGLRS